MNAIPMEIRLAGLFVVGLCLGSLVNLGVYRLAWHRRAISPWWSPPAEAPPRRALDRCPVVGWLGLRREAGLHGAGFWIRPILVELGCGVGMAWLYWWEVGQMALLPMPVPQPPAAIVAALHAQFACHVVLIGLMLAGSLIDADERIIPDSITVPGTLFGLAAAAIYYPWALLPDDLVFNQAGGLQVQQVQFMHLASPNPWPPGLGGFPLAWPLVLALGCWWLWCVALMPRTWYARHGWCRAIGLCLARLRRSPATRYTAILGLGTSAFIVGVWRCGGPHWQGLLSSLVGMAASGLLIWLVRILGTAALGREAMGFGDVTLMAMLGAMLGWQACLMVFFLAPFAGLAVGLVGLILHRGSEIPYGPYLSLAAVVTIVRWESLWNRTVGIFQPGWLVPAGVLVCLILMPVLLGLWRLVRGTFC